MKTLILFSTLGCHLCEQALELVTPIITDCYQIDEVDISESEALMEKYGIRIPVITRQDTGAEIGWPFDRQQFVEFIR
jgi:glutaredoxin